jgi:nitrous oxidase accessory protein NosD
MKTLEAICSFALLLILSAPILHAQNSASILVDDDKVQCPTAAFTTIQAAIDAASQGEHIRVCAGTYHEQLTINKSLTLGADNGVVLIPMAISANATGSTQSDQIAAVVLVENAASVVISGFRIDGSESGITECSPRLVGVLFQDASGRIQHNTVRHFRLGSALDGCQSGNAIEVETSNGAASSVAILDNSVDDYQKNGITANETGSRVTIDGNTVVGIGPTSGAAQNGIQIGFGAAGVITNNVVSNNVWSPCVSLAQCSTDATGILIFESDGVQVETNTIGTNNIGIFAGGNRTEISSNHVYNSLVLDGVVSAGNTNTVESNEIVQSDEASVNVQGNNNSISSNEFLGADFAILIGPGSTGTNISGNRFFATLTEISNAPAADASAKLSVRHFAMPTSASASGTAGASGMQRVSPSR